MRKRFSKREVVKPMVKRVTIKDIAGKIGVSSGTVHRALNGKPGVGDTLRERILETAREFGYRPNYVASSLKRKTLRIVAAFPGSTEQNRYYYTYVWQGFRDCMEELQDYNLQVIEIPYYNTLNVQGHELTAVLERYDYEVDGLITVGHAHDERGEQAIRQFINRDIPVMLTCDDIRDSGRMGCVQANYELTGRLVAELLSSQLSENSSVLIGAGDVMVPSHYGIVQGFDAYIKENDIHLKTIKVHGYKDEEEISLRMREYLINDPTIGAIYSVNARGSVMIGNLVKEMGLQGKLRVIGSDLFDENVANMRAGVLHNIIYKNPYQQAYLATRRLMDYLIKGEKPIEDVKYVESVVLFKSNLSMYL